MSKCEVTPPHTPERSVTVKQVEIQSKKYENSTNINRHTGASKPSGKKLPSYMSLLPNPIQPNIKGLAFFEFATR